MITPIISVIISAYNSERFIRGRFDDLINQSVFNLMEIILIDSASSESESIIAESFHRQYPERIRCVRTKKRESIYATWNRGIQLAKGKYITNANADDRLKSDGIEILYKALERNPEYALAYGDSLISCRENETFEENDGSQFFRWPDFDRSLLFKTCFVGPHPLWRKDLHEKYGFFDPSYISAGDYDFWLRISKNEKFLHVQQFVGLYYHNPNGIENSNKVLSMKESERARRSNLITTKCNDDEILSMKFINKKIRYSSDVSCIEYKQKQLKVELGYIFYDDDYNNLLDIFSFIQMHFPNLKETYAVYFDKIINDPQQFFSFSFQNYLDSRTIFFMPDNGEVPLCHIPQIPIKIHSDWILYASDRFCDLDNLLRTKFKVLSYPLHVNCLSLNKLIELDELFSLIKVLIQKKEYTRATKLLNHLKKENQINYESYKFSAQLEFLKGNFIDGFNLLSTAKNFNRHDFELIMIEAQAVSQLNETKKLYNSCYDYLQMYPDNLQVREFQIAIQNTRIDKNISESSYVVGEKRPYRVTAIVSTYNSKSFIRGCLEDLVGQSIANQLEIIVIDANSPDNEGRLVREFQKYNKNIHYFRTKQRISIYEAWNMGVKLAQGKYITPFSTNDSVCPMAYERMAGYLDSNEDVDLVFGDSYLTRTPHRKFSSFIKGEEKADIRNEYNFEYNLVYCAVGPHPMWRKSLHQKVGFFDEKYKRVSDQEFFMRVGRKYKIKHIPYFTGVYWEDDNAISAHKESYLELFTMRKHFRGVYSNEVIEDKILASVFLEIDNALQIGNHFTAKNILELCGNRLDFIPEIQALRRNLLIE
jgi:glycosyltransferase involved in cell wall biosynthesis